jgi:hypothetical protein
MMEAKLKDKAERHAISSHFGSINDSFGHQQPPEKPKPPSPASAEIPIIQQIQALLSSNAHETVEDVNYSKATPPSVQHQVVNKPRNESPPFKPYERRIVTCFYCGEPGHVLSHCPRRLSAIYEDHPHRAYNQHHRPGNAMRPLPPRHEGQRPHGIITPSPTPPRAYHSYLPNRREGPTHYRRPNDFGSNQFQHPSNHNHGHAQQPHYPPRTPVRPHHPSSSPNARQPSVRFSTGPHDADHRHSEATPMRRTTSPESGHVNVYLASTNIHSHTVHPMKCLTDLDVVPVPHVIHHWLDLCSGGTLVGVLSALQVGHTIKKITIVEKNHTIRYVAKQCLLKLTSRFPEQLSWEAIRDSECMTQDATKISIEDLTRLPTVTMVFATPPCQPFSRAGPSPGWNSTKFAPFISCVNLINDLYKRQHGRLTYILENVPKAAEFAELGLSLGTPLTIEAYKVGSSARRKTAIWTNGATTESLNQDYVNHHVIGPSVRDLLKDNYFPGWSATNYTSYHFPKFMSRTAS